MTETKIQIFIDRLKNEEHFSQKGALPAAYLELKSDEAIVEDINYTLEAYLTEDHLILQFDASCPIKLPCKICNEFTPIVIRTDKQTHTVSLEEVKKGIFDGAPLIRENILLLLPPFVECEGKCPERENLSLYLKSPSKKELTQNPFQGLDIS